MAERGTRLETRRDARRAEIQNVFEHFGVPVGRRGRPRRTGSAPGPDGIGQARSGVARGNVAAFAEGLNALGPIFQSFAIYLGTRPDLLTAPDRDLFTGFAPRFAPLTDDVARRILERELGDLASCIVALEPEVRVETPIWQERGARLADVLADGVPDDEAIRVRLLRPDAEEALLTHLDALSFLDELEVMGADGRPVELGGAVQDFLDDLGHEVDLREHARRIRGVGDGVARVRGVFPLDSLTTRGVMVYSRPAAGPLSQRGELDATFLLSKAWLTLALRDGILWSDPSSANAGLDDDGTIVVSGGRFDVVNEDFRADLERYFIATANGEPELSRTLLERRSAQLPGYARDRFGSLLRQAVPFRDHGLPRARAVPLLADTFFLQWRLARREGLRAHPELLAAWRGIASLDRARHPTDRVRDPLERALRRHRLRRALIELRRLPRPGEWRASLARAIPALLELMEREQDRDLRDGDPATDDGERNGGAVRGGAVATAGRAPRPDAAIRKGSATRVGGAAGAISAAMVLASAALALTSWREAATQPVVLTLAVVFLAFGAALVLRRRHEGDRYD